MKKGSKLEGMSPMHRRRFLKGLSAALAAPLIPAAFRQAANAIAGGEAYAADADAKLPRYFIEINLRDQWDHGHLMVAPGLATHSGLRRGETGNLAALFFAADELSRHQVNGTDVYLTRESKALEPHLDSIAMIDCCEIGQGDIHGHEAANPLRAPGKSKSRRAGQSEMWLNDPVANFPQGCEAYYSSTPTPATVFNHWQKQQTPGLKNGITFKGISRNIHTAYHHAASLGGSAELDRHYSRDTLFGAFPDKVEDYNILPTPEDAEALTQLVERLDHRALDARGYREGAISAHGAELADLPSRLYLGQPQLVSLPLTPEETAYWSTDVPNQNGGPVRGQIWEQVAWAYKLIASDQARAISLEFDWVDTHDRRTETQLRSEAAQVALPLARLIAKLKEAGLFERTVIAIYTTDGSREIGAGSYGDKGKNTLVLAGGGIRGGYFGDIQVAGNSGAGHTYRYHAPNDSGAPGPGSTDNGGRVSGAQIWRTVMTAAGVPDSMAGQFPDVASAKPLSFVLKG